MHRTLPVDWATQVPFNGIHRQDQSSVETSEGILASLQHCILHFCHFLQIVQRIPQWAMPIEVALLLNQRHQVPLCEYDHALAALLFQFLSVSLLENSLIDSHP